MKPILNMDEDFPTPNPNNTFRKLYNEFVHPPSKYSSSSNVKNNVVFASQVGNNFMLGTLAGSAYDFIYGRRTLMYKPHTRGIRSKFRALKQVNAGEATKPKSKFKAGLEGVQRAECSTRLGRFFGLYSLGAESLTYCAFVLRSSQERYLVDDVAITMVTSGVLLSYRGLPPIAAGAAAVAFGVFKVGDAGLRVILNHAFPESST